MSDLIKKIRSKAKNTVCDGEYSVKLTLDGKEIETILSALETVRGIEELAAEADLTLNIHPPLIDCHESCEDVRWLVEIDGSGFNGPTLSAAIEAARAKQ